MVKKKLSESVATRSTMVLRPRTRKPTTGVKNVKEKAKGKKAVASGKIRIVGAGAGKRKVKVDERNTETAENRAKRVKAMNKNEMDKGPATGSSLVLSSNTMNKNKMDKGPATGSSRVLRSNSAKKGGGSGKEVVKKESAKAKTEKPKKNLPAKKEAPLAIRSPKPKKNNPAIRSTRVLRPRKKTNIVVTNSVFPTEMLMEILSWLPVKFFGRPMVVCKQWYALIQNRHFIENHMSRNVDYYEPNPKPSVPYKYKYVYACDGLKLEKNTSTHKYHIRNPATKQLLEIPDPHKGSHGIFFSYVPPTGNYKVVSIYDDKNNIECCEVLSVGTDEFSWRLLKMPTRDYLKRNRKKFSAVSTGDAVHCVRVIASEDDMVEEVVSLDLVTEQFTVTDLPRDQYRSWEKVWPLNYFGKLALVDKIGADLCVLVLENYKKQKWGKKKPLITLAAMKQLEDKYGTFYPYSFDQSEILRFWVKDKKFSISYDIGKKNEIPVVLRTQYSLVHLKGMQPESKTLT